MSENTSLNPTIFVIDDDEINNVIVSTYIKRYHITDSYFVFDSAVKALNHIRENGKDSVPEIIILDVKMPDMDGFEFLDAYEPIAAEFGKKSAVYMLSSSVRMNDKERSFQYKSVVDYIEKPMTLPQIRRIINDQSEEIDSE
jgi:CheY-like chemotaxis protein